MNRRRPPTPPRRIRGTVVAGLAVLALAGPATAVAPAAAPQPRPWAAAPLVVLLGDHVARRAPNADAARIEAVAARRPLTRVRTVLPVLGRRGPDGAWLRVRLPGRPNGHTGWIAAARTRPASTPWRIVVSLSTRRVLVSHAGRVVRRFTAIVGKPSTPTPTGSFFVEEALRLSPGAAGAPFALATSARSDSLHEFDGGPGQIALHGTGNLSGSPGTAASHGCVRLTPRAIAWLAARIGAGVPLSIVRHAGASSSSPSSNLRTDPRGGFGPS
jgi:lipoprotein-anchoring transpeptidase ErfK/SrfK